MIDLSTALPKILLTPDAIDYYYDHPVDFVDDNILDVFTFQPGSSSNSIIDRKSVRLYASRSNICFISTYYILNTFFN